MGYGTRVGVDGNITTFVNDKTLDAFDRETFGVTRGELDTSRSSIGTYASTDKGALQGQEAIDAEAAAAAALDNTTPTSRGGTTPDTTTPDTGGGGYNASDYGGYSGSETQSSGESYANYKGGFIKKKKNVAKPKKGLASR
jgi:hypothetical protein